MEGSTRHIHYRRQFVRCGKPACRSCATGPSHGPYLYAVWHEGARTRTRYIGKSLPPAAGAAGATLGRGNDAAPRIAIISDEVQARAAMRAALIQAGYDTRLPTEGPGAFLALMQAPPDALLVALRLECVENYALMLSLVRLLPPLRTVPIIACTPTAAALAATLEPARLGCTVLATPFARHDLLRLLRQLLAGANHPAGGHLQSVY